MSDNEDKRRHLIQRNRAMPWRRWITIILRCKWIIKQTEG